MNSIHNTLLRLRQNVLAKKQATGADKPSEVSASLPPLPTPSPPQPPPQSSAPPLFKPPTTRVKYEIDASRPSSMKPHREQSEKKVDDKYRHYCDLCESDCGSAASLQAHIGGKSHKKKLLQQQTVGILKTPPTASTAAPSFPMAAVSPSQLPTLLGSQLLSPPAPIAKTATDQKRDTAQRYGTYLHPQNFPMTLPPNPPSEELLNLPGLADLKSTLQFPLNMFAYEILHSKLRIERAPHLEDVACTGMWLLSQVASPVDIPEVAIPSAEQATLKFGQRRSLVVSERDFDTLYEITSVLVGATAKQTSVPKKRSSDGTTVTSTAATPHLAHHGVPYWYMMPAFKVADFNDHLVGETLLCFDRVRKLLVRQNCGEYFESRTKQLVMSFVETRYEMSVNHPMPRCFLLVEELNTWTRDRVALPTYTDARFLVETIHYRTSCETMMDAIENVYPRRSVPAVRPTTAAGEVNTNANANPHKKPRTKMAQRGHSSQRIATTADGSAHSAVSPSPVSSMSNIMDPPPPLLLNGESTMVVPVPPATSAVRRKRARDHSPSSTMTAASSASATSSTAHGSVPPASFLERPKRDWKPAVVVPSANVFRPPAPMLSLRPLQPVPTELTAATEHVKAVASSYAHPMGLAVAKRLRYLQSWTSVVKKEESLFEPASAARAPSPTQVQVQPALKVDVSAKPPAPTLVPAGMVSPQQLRIVREPVTAAPQSLPVKSVPPARPQRLPTTTVKPAAAQPEYRALPSLIEIPTLAADTVAVAPVSPVLASALPVVFTNTAIPSALESTSTVLPVSSLPALMSIRVADMVVTPPSPLSAVEEDEEPQLAPESDPILSSNRKPIAISLKPRLVETSGPVRLLATPMAHTQVAESDVPTEFAPDTLAALGLGDDTAMSDSEMMIDDVAAESPSPVQDSFADSAQPPIAASAALAAESPSPVHDSFADSAQPPIVASAALDISDIDIALPPTVVSLIREPSLPAPDLSSDGKLADSPAPIADDPPAYEYEPPVHYDDNLEASGLVLPKLPDRIDDESLSSLNVSLPVEESTQDDRMDVDESAKIHRQEGTPSDGIPPHLRLDPTQPGGKPINVSWKEFRKYHPSNKKKRHGPESFGEYYERKSSVKITHWDHPLMECSNAARQRHILIPDLTDLLGVTTSMITMAKHISHAVTQLRWFATFTEVTQKLGLVIDNKRIAQQCFTPMSVSAVANYEKLEFLGDAVLDYMTSIRLYFSMSIQSTEGRLTDCRTDVVGNKALWRVLARLELTQLVRQDLSRINVRLEKHDMFSDVFEAFVGTVFLDKGLGEVGNFLDEHVFKVLQLPLTMKNPPEAVPTLSPADLQLVEACEKKLGYVFHNKWLMVRALTAPRHCSHPQCHYQRLEFMGDTVLKMVYSCEAFAMSPLSDECTLSYYRAAFVGNANLNKLAFELGLHEAVGKAATHSPCCPQLNKAAAPVNEADYNTKTFSDVFEATIGAIFLDCLHREESESVPQHPAPAANGRLRERLFFRTSGYRDGQYALREIVMLLDRLDFFANLRDVNKNFLTETRHRVKNRDSVQAEVCT